MDLSIYNCEGCSATFTDLIKCNLCTKFVYESCSRVIVSKIKVAIHNCKSVYFICNSCEGAMPDPPSQSEHDNHDKREQPNLEQILPKLQILEDTIDQTISKKLAESYKCMEENIIKVNKSYAERMKSSIPSTQGSPCPNFREIICETQNEELVQLKEREARVFNIIIHGLR